MRVDNMLDIFYQKERVHEILNKRKVVYKYDNNKPTYLNKDLWYQRIIHGFYTEYSWYELSEIYHHFYPSYDSGGAQIISQLPIYNLELIQRVKFVTLSEYINLDGVFISLDYPVYDFDTWKIIDHKYIHTNLNENGDIFFGINVEYINEEAISTLYIVTTGSHIILPNDLSYFFSTPIGNKFKNLEVVDFNDIVTVENDQSIINLEGICKNCSKLSFIDFNQLNIKQISNLKESFYNCSLFTNQLSFLSDINSCYIQDMEKAFYGCENLTELDISKLNISQVQSMNYAFYFCGHPRGNSEYIFDFTIDLISVLNQAQGKLERAFSGCNLNCLTLTLNNSILNILEEGCFSGALMKNITLNFDNRHFTKNNTPEYCFNNATLKEISLKNIQVDNYFGANSPTNVLTETGIFSGCIIDKFYLNNAYIDGINFDSLPSFYTNELLDLTNIQFNNVYYGGYKINNHPWYNELYAAQIISNLMYQVAGELNLTGYQFTYPNVFSNRMLNDDLATTKIHMIEATGRVPSGYVNKIYAGFEPIEYYRNNPNRILKKLNLSYTNVSSINLGQIEAWHWEEYISNPGSYSIHVDEMSESYIEEIILSHNTNNNNYHYLSISGGQRGENSLKSVDCSYNILNGIPNISEFETSGWGNGSNSLKSLNLSNLTLNNTDFSLTNYPQLESLNITNLKLNKTNPNFRLGTPKLEQINLNDIDWSNVINVDNISFSGCSSLTSLDLSPVPSLNIINGNEIFKNCNDLTTINFGNLNFNNCNTGGKELFYHCQSLTQLNLSSFNFNSFQDCTSMFEGCSSLTQITLPQMNNLTNMYRMFYDCVTLASLNINNINTSNVTNMSRLFYNCKAITTNIMANIIPYLIVDNVTNLSDTFSGCTSLTSIDISNFNTNKVKNMYGIFKNCTNLTSINLNNIDTSNVENMGCMFDSCENLTSINVTGFNTNKVTSMYGMFINCKSLMSIDVNNFNTSNVKTMNYMFSGCESLASIDVSNFDVSKLGSVNVYYNDHVKNIGDGCIYMFAYCTNLNSISLFDLNISEQQLSSNTIGIPLEGMFKNCNSLTSLNLKHFHYYYHEYTKPSDTNTYYYGFYMEDMFLNCLALTTINTYDSSYDDTSNVQSSVFYLCNSLVGGNGTTYSMSHRNSDYARVDTREHPGYFTLIQEPA